MSKTEYGTVEAIHDLIRVLIVLDKDCSNKAAGVRKLAEAGLPASRIASIMDMKTSDVTSQLAKDRKRQLKRSDQNGQANASVD